MLTKSLHTVTSCTAVAMYLARSQAHSPDMATPLVVDALALLGYRIDTADLNNDTTVAACIKSVRKALAKAGT